MGWDPREARAYAVAEATLQQHRKVPVTALKLERLELQGLLRRPREIVGNQTWDVISEAPMATEFAISRFLTPVLAQGGIAIFMDCDVLVLADIQELVHIAEAQPHIAMWCVQHEALGDHVAREGVLRVERMLKMDGQVQTYYRRKNWSSVMVFNCDHPATLGWNLDRINHAPGRDLHGFRHIPDQLIGRLPAEWNWLVGVQPKPAQPKIAHYTLGGPWLPGWETREHDDLWLDAAKDLGARE